MKVENVLKILSAVTTVLLASAEVIKQVNLFREKKAVKTDSKIND